MRPARRELLQLAGLVAAAVLVAILLRTNRPLGEYVGGRPAVRAILADTSSPAEGAEAADLTLVVFTDYRCPACRVAHPAMRRAAAADGKVRIVYKDWPIFGAASERAAEVALASRYQGIYPRVHDRLMTGRTEGEDALRSAVEAAGGNWARLEDDLAANRASISTALAHNSRQAFALGLAGTPGYLAGPLLVRGALDEAEFRRLFRKARDAA